MSTKQQEHLKNILQKAKLRMLRMHFEANCGHIGGNFSCIDSMIVLFHEIMSEEDRFVLSKGHSAAALYTSLWSIGKLSDADLSTFYRDNTKFPAHPSCISNNNILFSTGSLGHGASISSGLSLAAKIQNNTRHTYCLCSDGEWQEGSCWESLIFSVHNKLNNLTIMIDQNGLQGFGTTQDIVSYSDITSRIMSFGAHVQTIDGHNLKQLVQAFRNKHSEKPNFIILKTKKGNSLHFENKLDSHYLPLTQSQYEENIINITAEL